MKPSTLFCLLPFTLLAVSVSAYAASPETEHHIKPYNVYFGLDAAYVHTKSDSGNIKDSITELTGSTPSVSEDNNTGAGRIFAGYKFNDNLSVELAYVKTGKLKAKINDDALGYSGSAKADVKGIELSALLSPSQLPNLFFKAGATYLKVQSSASLTGAFSGSDSTEDKGLGYVLGAGYKYPVNDMVDIKAAYSYYGKIANESSYDAHMLSLGMQLNF